MARSKQPVDPHSNEYHLMCILRDLGDMSEEEKRKEVNALLDEALDVLRIQSKGVVLNENLITLLKEKVEEIAYEIKQKFDETPKSSDINAARYIVRKALCDVCIHEDGKKILIREANHCLGYSPSTMRYHQIILKEALRSGSQSQKRKIYERICEELKNFA